MRFPILALVALPFTACFPARPLQKTTTAPPALIERIQRVESSAPAPAAPVNPPRATVLEISGITFEGVSFDSRNNHLVVTDQANGPGSQYAGSAAAARALGGLAAVNAGFFTPEGNPLGLVASSGKFSGAWNTASSLGSAAWYENNSSGNMAISRREKLGRAGASILRELIQAGPLLVENGRATGGLEATKSSARTVILWDGGTRWWIGCGSPCTLAALGQALATAQPAGWPVRQALNLDGGRSSDLWISEAVPGGPVLRRPPWNRPVRNFLVLVAR